MDTSNQLKVDLHIVYFYKKDVATSYAGVLSYASGLKVIASGKVDNSTYMKAWLIGLRESLRVINEANDQEISINLYIQQSKVGSYTENLHKTSIRLISILKAYMEDQTINLHQLLKKHSRYAITNEKEQIDVLNELIELKKSKTHFSIYSSIDVLTQSDSLTLGFSECKKLLK